MVNDILSFLKEQIEAVLDPSKETTDYVDYLDQKEDPPVFHSPITIILANLGNEAFTIERGMRIAQMVIARHAMVEWNKVEDLDETERGAGGFGSTGTNG